MGARGKETLLVIPLQRTALLLVAPRDAIVALTFLGWIQFVRQTASDPK